MKGTVMDFHHLKDILSGANDRNLHLSGKDAVKTAAVLSVAALTCLLIKPIASGDSHVPLIFVLAVLIVSRATEGYVYGLIAALISVIGVNYAFTYPYYNINFSITGYPLTFFCMFAVSVITCTLTARARKSDLIHAQNERERLRSELLRSISHDLRTPLTTISGSAGLLLENYEYLSEKETQALLSDIIEEIEWLNMVIDNTLSVTRFRVGTEDSLPVKPEIVEEIIEESVRRFRRQTAASRTKIHIQVPEEILMIPVNAMLIEQVLINLLNNAVWHGKRTSRIDIIVEKRADRVYFRVLDDGCGIEESILPHLFDEDALADRTKEDDANRFMGIGLSACRAIIEQHHGEISAKNRPEGGSELCFWLPLEHQPEQQP